MPEFIQIITILAYLSIICGFIRVRKLLLYVIKCKTAPNNELYNVKTPTIKKKYWFLFHTIFMIFITLLGAHIIKLALTLDNSNISYADWYFYTKDAMFITILLLILRISIIELKSEIILITF